MASRTTILTALALFTVACSPAAPPVEDATLVMPTMTVTAKAPPLDPTAAAVPEPPSHPATRIALDEDGGCAVLADGGVSCWGARFAIAPRRVAGVTGAVDVSLGADLAIVHGDGAVSVFVRGDTSVPARSLASKEPVLAVSQGRDLACVLRKDGHVSCWQGGFFDGAGKPGKRVEVQGITDATSFGLSGEFGCALRADHRVTCWKLSGPPKASPIPTLVGAVELTLGLSTGCTRDELGEVSCFWLHEKLEKPTSIGRGRALAVSGDYGSWPNVCRDEGTVTRCSRPKPFESSWTVGSLDESESPSIAGDPVKQLVATRTAACSLTESGRVHCWGYNIGAVLGRPDTRFVESPRVVPNLPALKAVATGDRFTCGLATDGEVFCWGVLPGIEGVEKAPVAPAPLGVPGVTDAVRLVANADYACAFSDTDEATCFFGHPSDGKLKATRTPPFDHARFVALPDLGFANAIAAIDGSGQLMVGPTSDFDTTKGLVLTPVAGIVPARELAIVNMGLYASQGSYGFVLARGPDGKVVSVEVTDAGVKPPKTLQGLDGALALQDEGMALLPGGKVVAGRIGRPAATLLEKSPLVTLANGSRFCGMNAEGSFGCMRGERFEVLFEKPAQVASSGAHECALDDKGVLRCRGSNSAGECGVLEGVFRSNDPLELRFPD